MGWRRVSIAVCLQVRLDSSRLPGKALINVKDLTIVEHAMKALKKVKADKFLLLTTEDSQKELAPFAEKWGFSLFTGSKEDVLQRFVEAARFHEVKTIIRATGDNPLVSAQMANEVLEEHLSLESDYTNWTGAPLGTGIEVVETRVLEEAMVLSSESYDHEHVTPWIYNNPQKYNLNIHSVPQEYFYDIKVSVDTRDDLEEMEQLYTHLYKSEPIEILPLVSYLKGCLLIPALGKGNGLGHLKRMIQLSETLKCRSWIYVSKEDYLEYGSWIPEHLQSRIVNDFEKVSTVEKIILDNRKTDLDFILKQLDLSKIIGIDEGGEVRNTIPYLIDILPLPDSFLTANIRSLSFLELPEPKRVEKNGKILISFGGEDPADLSWSTLEQIKDYTSSFIEKVTVVLGPLYKGKVTEEFCEVIRGPESLEKILPLYDGLICSFGLTAYEALNQGVPVLLINPSDYHQTLTELEEFPSAGVGIQNTEILHDFLKSPQTYQTNTKDFSGPSLAGHIDTIQMGNNNCPLCGSASPKIIERFSYKTYCRCQNCHMLFMINFQKEKMDYSEEYFFTQYEAQYGKTYLEDFSHLKKMAAGRLQRVQKKLKPEANVLDVGCAYGPFLDKAAQLGYKCFGTDISQEAVDYVTEELGYKAVNCPFESFNIPVSWDVETFDLVTMWYVIEHFQDLKVVLKKVNELLELDGFFAFSTPNGSGISSKNNMRKFLNASPDDHYSVWEPQLCEQFLKLYGFTIESIRITGHHPERFPSNLKKSSLGSKILNRYSRIKGLGDTFEIYARKVRNI